jgi:hypothetical protein
VVFAQPLFMVQRRRWGIDEFWVRDSIQYCHSPQWEDRGRALGSMPMDEKIVVALVSAMFGFSLPYLAGVWDRSKRVRRIKSAVMRELSEVTADIEAKMAWVGRDVPGDLEETDASRIVELDGRRLYLGEREKFEVSRAYWNSKYTQIAEEIGNRDFSDFYAMHRLVDRFERKFAEMKLTFEISVGKNNVMGRACFFDLKRISEELRDKLTRKSG